MTLLNGHRVLVLDSAAQTALPRFLGSLGAQVAPIKIADLAAHLAGASFFIEDLGAARLEDLGWSRERVQRTAPRVIHVSVSTFGSDAPRARWSGNELIASAMGGVLRLTGMPDRAPVKEALDACRFHADMVAALGALAAHYERNGQGAGQHVDVSVQEVAFSRQFNSVLVWQFDRRKLHRVGGALNYGLATVRCIWPLADGWCFHTLMTGRFGAPANQGLSDWMDESGVTDNPLRGVDWVNYNRSTLDAVTRASWEKAIESFFRTRSKRDIAGEGRRRAINATVIAEPQDVLADAHLGARQFWEQETPDGMRVPKRFVSLQLGAGNGARAPAAHRPPAAGRPGPLAGIRVLDFSWALVGSITTKTLGDLGADVIKVESRTRPCLTRLDVQVSASKAGNFDDKPWFAHLNSSKRSLALDMKRAESREVLDPLIRWADVVVENFSPGTMRKLGLDYETLSRVNPGLIMVSGSVYGQSGPLAQEWGVDGTGAALSGRTYLTGWPDRDPVIPGAVPYGDVIVPYVMAAAAAGALQYRRESGKGAHIDASMYEICVQQMRDAILQSQTPVQPGLQPRRSGNLDAGVFHQGVYAVQGEDQWLAIALPTRDAWQRLRAYATLPAAEDAPTRDAVIERWTRDQAGPDLMAQLQSAGIAAGVVQDIQELMERDPQLAARGALLDIEHASLGRFGHMRTPLTFSRSTMQPFRAPNIGEHSQSVATQLSGLQPERVAELERLGVFR
jgi:crotonobetainyl-CoA:carnitine CoA-transferase CaiB-like acyl-CoA transferase